MHRSSHTIIQHAPSLPHTIIQHAPLLSHCVLLQVSNWLTMEIVSTENFEERVALVSRLVDIMVVCVHVCVCVCVCVCGVCGGMCVCVCVCVCVVCGCGCNSVLSLLSLQALRELNNFAGMFVINAAFESSSVFRLKQTFRVSRQCLYQWPSTALQ